MSKTELIGTVRFLAPNIRVAYARMSSPERADQSPAYSLFADEGTLDKVQTFAGEMRWESKRLGPRELWIDPEPNYLPTTQGNYESVWDD